MTTFGSGENSTVSVMISQYFGQVLNLKADVNNYTMTIQWDKPRNIEVKEIKVPANPQAENSGFLSLHVMICCHTILAMLVLGILLANSTFFL